MELQIMTKQLEYINGSLCFVSCDVAQGLSFMLEGGTNESYINSSLSSINS
jgi:hypothetical protein